MVISWKRRERGGERDIYRQRERPMATLDGEKGSPRTVTPVLDQLQTQRLWWYIERRLFFVSLEFAVPKTLVSVSHIETSMGWKVYATRYTIFVLVKTIDLWIYRN